MALNNNGTYTYVGTTANAFYKGIYTMAKSYDEAVKFEKVKHSIILPAFDTRNPFNDSSCDFDDSNADVEYNPVKLIVNGFSIQKQVCFDELVDLDLSQFLPAGANNDGIDGTIIEEQLQEIVFAAASEQLERLLWRGDTAAGPASALRFFDGWIKQLVTAGADTVPSAVDINTGNFATQMNLMHAQIIAKFPEAWTGPDFYLRVPMDVWGLYLAHIAGQNNVSGQLTDHANTQGYWNGVKLKPVTGLAASTMVASESRNFAVGTDLTSDMASLVIVNMLYTTGEPKVRMVGRIKMGTQIRRKEDALLYKP
jgi:hypothetical protein